MVDLVDPVVSLETEVESAPRKRSAHLLSARGRIELLLDVGSFDEIDAGVVGRPETAGTGSKENVIGGCGKIGGRQVYLFAQDPEVFAGTLSEAGAGKICKLLDLALSNGAPFIGLYDGRGARITDGIDALGGFGEIYMRQVASSGVIPQLAVVLGPCVDGGALSVGLADFVVVSEDGGEITLAESKGDASDCMAEGLCHFVGSETASCLVHLRQLLSYLPDNNLDPPPLLPTEDDPGREVPWLDDFVPTSSTQPYDMSRLIQGVVDDGRFLEIQAEYARNMLVGFARFGGRPVGIFANQPLYLAGVIDIAASLKASRFVRFCDAFNLPVVVFADVPGFLPGVQQELGGIIRHGAKMIFASGDSTVPKVTVVTRKAYGGAYGVMNCKHLRTDVNLAYPQAEIAVMGSEGAVNVLYRKELKAAGDRREELRSRLVQEYRKKFSNPYQAAKHGFVDAVIRPRETRSQIVRALSRLAGKRVDKPRRKHDNQPL